MSRPPFTHGLVAVAPGIHAFLQPDGSWGLSNAGLVEDSGEALLVDTLFDRRRTREMLAQMRRASTARIDAVVNTHANGDHCYGNVELGKVRIIASRRGAGEMADMPPRRLAMFVAAARAAVAAGPLTRGAAKLAHAARLGPIADLLDAAPLVVSAFGRFDFTRTPLVPPNEVFDDELDVKVGGRTVKLIEVGPAHTEGDVMVWVPDARTLFTGDILFIEGHPVVWAGPISHWIAALDRVIALAPDVIVPGHGPMTDLAGVRRLREYFVHIDTESRKRHAAGMDAESAARDIALDAFSTWTDPERVAVNVEAVYRELEGRTGRVNPVKMFGRMARVAKSYRR